MYIKTVVLNAFWTTYFVNKLYDFDEEQYMFLRRTIYALQKEPSDVFDEGSRYVLTGQPGMFLTEYKLYTYIYKEQNINQLRRSHFI